MNAIKNIIKISKIPKTCRERYLNLKLQPAEILQLCGIRFSGLSNLKPGYQVGDTNPADDYMVIITLGGEGGLLASDGEYYNLDIGSVIIRPPGVACTFATTEDRWDIAWFYIRKTEGLGLRLKDVITGMKFWHEHSILNEFEAAMEGFLLESERYASQYAGADRAVAVYAELIDVYLDRLFFAQAVKCDKRNSLDELWRKVKKNLADDWQVSGLAAMAEVSESTFQRLVKQEYGVSPRKYLIQLRIEEAKQLIKMTRYPLSTIAERLGYSNEFALAFAFKRHTGVSPGAYRKTYKLA